MQFVSHSTSLSSLASPSLTHWLAPVQALVAFFAPAQPVWVCRPAVAERTTQRTTQRTTERSLNLQTHNKAVAAAATQKACSHPASRLKVMREFEPGMARSQTGRMAISGRMADVCAELDRIASTR